MNHYARAIDALNQEVDWKQIAIDYAKRHPADFVRATNRITAAPWTESVLLEPTKVECIKAIRMHTGWGLHESKRWADAHYNR